MRLFSSSGVLSQIKSPLRMVLGKNKSLNGSAHMGILYQEDQV